ncbi:hypothetical protein C8Q74DRAFT_1452806 [Fomes fomentarius]|nr:hypothetical protein C8Q74DRAFT_1452806 [Fomes fomentarius]
MHPAAAKPAYDAVALFYVFHCRSDPLREKAANVSHNVAPLAPGGIVGGTTILGEGVRIRLLGLYNKKGVFGNREDSEEVPRSALDVTRCKTT